MPPGALIPLASDTVAGVVVQTVDARELHNFLGVRRDFTTWVRAALDKYAFTEGTDYVTTEGLTSPNRGSAKSRAQRTAEFHLTLDTAKQLSMVANTERGAEARRYFIDCERQAKAAAALPINGDIAAALNDPHALRRFLQASNDRELQLEAKVEADAPKVAFAESVVAAPDAISIGQAAKILGTGRNRLVAFMRKAGWLTRTNEPYQPKINAGLLDVKLSRWKHPEQGLKSSVTALVTGKGLAVLRKLLADGSAAQSF